MIDKPLTPIAAMHDLDHKGHSYTVTISLFGYQYREVDVYAHSANWIEIGVEKKRLWVNTAHILSIEIHEH